MHRWIEIRSPLGTQYVRADQVVGVMPVGDKSGAPVIGASALLVQGFPQPVVVNKAPAALVGALERDDGPRITLNVCGEQFPSGKP